jgi:DNA invertase Pin-like site-specific DNA recombinase
MIYGFARVSTDGLSVEAQVKQLRAAGVEKIYRETASGAKTDRAKLRRLLDRLARSTRDLLNILATIAEKKAGFRSLGDTWADTTTPHGRLMLTVLESRAP